MSDRHDPAGRCAAMGDQLSLVALGIGDGRERSTVLAHVESCADCRAQLDELTAVAETVQQLAPDVQPPLGFESRVVERWRSERSVAHRSRRAAWMGVAAAFLVLAATVGVVRHFTHESGAAVAAPVTADLVAAGQVVGSVVVTPGNPAWMLMTIQGGQFSGTVSCEVTMANGTVATVGTFALSGAYPSWSAPLPADGGAPIAARLVDTGGHVLASAVLGA